MAKLANLNEAILNLDKTKENNRYGDADQNDILYSRWKTRYAETIGDFYTDFIEPRLPKTEIVLEWNDMLIKYSKMPGAVFPIRGGYSKKDEMRRGWLVRVNGGVFSYTFTDNYFPAYIYKMALDGFCPELDEFYEYMTGRSSKDTTNMNGFVKENEINWLRKKHIKNVFDDTEGKERCFLRMPISYGPFSGSEIVKNVYINTDPAPICPLGDCGYKHAHVFDVKGEYKINDGCIKKWDKIKVSLGEESDYRWQKDINNYAWNRTVEPCEVDMLRKTVVAHFLRLCDPINHFLSPDSGYNKFTEENGDYSLDIGEYNNLLLHLMSIREKEFGNDYEEFKIAAMSSSELKSADHSTDIIHVVYHEKKQGVANRKNKKDKEKEIAEKAVTRSKKKAEKESTDTTKLLSKAKSSVDAEGAGGGTIGKRDNSKYLFDDKKHAKSSLIVALVDKYLEEHTDAKVSELDGVFNLILFYNNKQIILQPQDTTDSLKLKAPKRTLSDGTIIYINNQVQIKDMPEIIRIANRLNYTIVKV